MKNDAVELLQLPPAEKIPLRLRSLYRKWCKTLEVRQEGNVVLGEIEYFYVSSDDQMKERDAHMLQLSSLVMGMTHDEVKSILEDTEPYNDGDEDWVDTWQDGEGSPFVAWAVMEMASVIDIPETSLFSFGTSKRVLYEALLEWDGTSGFFFREWRPGWAVVMWVYRLFGCEKRLIPWVCGFVRTDDLHRNAGRFLAEMDAPYAGAFFSYAGALYSSVDMRGDDFLLACWGRNEYGEKENYAAFFLELSDEQIQAYRKAYGSLVSKKLLNDLSGAYDKYEWLMETQERERNDLLAELAHNSGIPRKNDHLEKLAKRFEKAAEKMQQTGDIRKKSDVLFHLFGALDPVSMPHDTLLSRLSVHEIYRIEKWLNRSFGSRSIRITRFTKGEFGFFHSHLRYEVSGRIRGRGKVHYVYEPVSEEDKVLLHDFLRSAFGDELFAACPQCRGEDSPKDGDD